MKVFISQPMRGKTDDQIHKEYDCAVKCIKALHPNAQIIDSFIHEDLDEEHPGLRYLARSIDLLDQADMIFMMPGWEKMRGCRIEHECATQYGVIVRYMNELEVDNS